MRRVKDIVILLAVATALIACEQEGDETGQTEPPPEADVVGSTGDDLGAGPPADAVTTTEPEDHGEPTGDFAIVEQACRALPNASDALCACVQDQARELSADELGLAAAQYTGDETKAVTHREQLDIMGLSRGGGFLMNAPFACKE